MIDLLPQVSSPGIVPEEQRLSATGGMAMDPSEGTFGAEILPVDNFGSSDTQIDINSHSTPTRAVLPSARSVSFSTLSSDSSGTLVCRPLVPEDLQEVKDLHKLWFPVRYKEGFYRSAVQGRFETSGREMYNEAVVQIEGFTPSSAQNDGPLSSSCTSGHAQRILAMITGQFIPIEECDESELLAESQPGDCAMYIMTLGALEECRRQGYASVLVRRAAEAAGKTKHCKMIYLHVIISNVAAQRFYEKLGFKRVREEKGYYYIDLQFYDAYIYALYLNGGVPAISWIERLSRSWRNLTTLLTDSLWRILRPAGNTSADRSTAESLEGSSEYERDDPQDLADSQTECDGIV